MFFGQYLLENNFIEPIDLLEALRIHENSRIPIGELAVDNSFLKKDSVEEIISIQKDENKYFGEIALERGLLDNRTLEKLLEEQKGTKKKIGRCLVELGALSSSDVLNYLLDYSAENAKIADRYVNSIHYSGHKEFLLSALSILKKTLLRITRYELKIVDINSQKIEKDLEIYTQRIRGDINITMAIALSKDTKELLCNKILNNNLERNEAVLDDTIEELLDIIVGSVKLNSLSKSVKISKESPQKFSRAQIPHIDSLKIFSVDFEIYNQEVFNSLSFDHKIRVYFFK